MPQSNKFVEKVTTEAKLKRDGIISGAHIVHKATKTEVILGIRDKDGAFWGMTLGPKAKKGKLLPMDLLRYYEVKK